MSQIEENCRFTSDVSARAKGWFQRFEAVQGFTQATGNIPRHRGQDQRRASESELADWLRYQRRRRARGNATTAEVALLESLPGFGWNPKDKSWEAALLQLNDFLDQSGGLPPRVRCSDIAERRLATWVDSQRRNLREQRLSVDRRNALWRTLGPL
jgi:hypothetical protein